MTVARDSLSPSKEPRRLSGTLLAAIVIAIVLMVLGCAGACGGFFYLSAPQAQRAMRRANIQMPRFVAPNPNDWMTTRTQTEIYTSSLEAVVANEAVVEALGAPVMPNLEADELYRNKTDPLAGDGRHIEYDVVGPQGAATVAVKALTPETINEITVTLQNGSTIEVPPPVPKPFVVR